MKIGIFGGSFNPPTKGHVRLANYIATSGVVDKVYMMPCYESLYSKSLVDGEHRLNMLSVIERAPNVFPYDWEIRNQIKGMGTYEIMKKLEEELAGNELYFIIGLDNSQKVRGWRNGDRIVEELKFIVVPRIGTNTTDIWFMNPPHIWLAAYEADDFSSTKAREKVWVEENIGELLCPQVSDYIRRQGLYKS